MNPKIPAGYKSIRKSMTYISDMPHFDGCVPGRSYIAIAENADRYYIYPNIHGGGSQLLKTKFDKVKDISTVGDCDDYSTDDPRDKFTTCKVGDVLDLNECTLKSPFSEKELHIKDGEKGIVMKERIMVLEGEAYRKEVMTGELDRNGINHKGICEYMLSELDKRFMHVFNEVIEGYDLQREDVIAEMANMLSDFV